MPRHLRDLFKRVAWRLLSPVPSHLARNFIRMDKAGLSRIEDAIREHYHTGWRSRENYSDEQYETDLRAHLYGRLETDRREIIPWLDSARPLRNASVLEIGSGTGSSTIALAEQGARITAIDIDEGALLVAKQRATVYGVHADFGLLNAQDISRTFRGSNFDLVIFFACLEHMTIGERLASLSDAWAMLPRDGLLIIVETPNRLWYFDSHTSMLPFFHWLPHELAFAYSRFSPRENFRERYREYNAAFKEHFLRRGRGMSFHEIDMSIGNTRNLKVVSSLSSFRGMRYKVRRSRLERQYKAILRSIYPGIHEGWFDEYLYIIIQKV